jgi:hypothetical protein
MTKQEPVSEMASLANLPPPKAAVVVSTFDDEGWGDNDWDFEDVKEEKVIDIKAKEYQNKNLNKLSDEELAKHKKAMDKEFDKNFVKPNDKNFVYDKVVDF